MRWIAELGAGWFGLIPLVLLLLNWGAHGDKAPAPPVITIRILR